MFGPLGLPELLMIFAVALIVFGPRRLPEIGKTIGKALNEFKKATDDLKNTIEREVEVEETRRMISPLVNPATYTVSRAEPVAAPAGDEAQNVADIADTTADTPAAAAAAAGAPTATPTSPTPTHFE
jgi:sec-independent protein translocase protein TatA